MKQNVKGTTAAVVIVFAIVVAFLVGSHLKPAAEDKPFVLPQTPPTRPNEVEDMYRGLTPLGIAVVVPPLSEDRTKGARVSGVEMGKPGHQAGLQMGDLITSFDGKTVRSKDQLVAYLTEVVPGKAYPMTVIRSDKAVTLKVTGLQALPLEQRVRE